MNDDVPILRVIKMHAEDALRKSDPEHTIMHLVGRMTCLAAAACDPDTRTKILAWKTMLATSSREQLSYMCNEVISQIIHTLSPTTVEAYLCTVFDIRYDRNIDWDRVITALSTACTPLAIDPKWSDPSAPLLVQRFGPDSSRLICIIGCSHMYLPSATLKTIVESRTEPIVHSFCLNTKQGSRLILIAGPSPMATSVAKAILSDIVDAVS